MLKVELQELNVEIGKSRIEFKYRLQESKSIQQKLMFRKPKAQTSFLAFRTKQDRQCSLNIPTRNWSWQLASPQPLFQECVKLPCINMWIAKEWPKSNSHNQTSAMAFPNIYFPNSSVTVRFSANRVSQIVCLITKVQILHFLMIWSSQLRFVNASPASWSLNSVFWHAIFEVLFVELFFLHFRFKRPLLKIESYLVLWFFDIPLSRSNS